MNLLERPQRLYIVGIKGVGMTALAQLLAARGHVVTGSDVAETFFTDAVLREHHIPFTEGFRPENLPNAVDAVIFSTAYTLDHPELKEARRRGIPLYTYPEMLGELFQTSEGISVAGTHGKTTTTALLGAILSVAGRDPTVIVGSNIPLFHGNARIGRSELLVVETDEYQNKFTHYWPTHLVVTNIEYDHPDFFQTEEKYTEAFHRFFSRLPANGVLVSNADDPHSQAILRALGRPSLRFGLQDGADFRLTKHAWLVDREVFTIKHDRRSETFFVRMPGCHNALNACAAIAFASAFDVPMKAVRDALEEFTGITRRFEQIGQLGDVPIFDDYAHHPTEIAAALAAARERFSDRRLIAVFQPHTYSRTKALLNDFAAALRADCVVLLEVYGSARETTKTVSSSDILAAMPKGSNAVFQPTLTAATAFLKKTIRDGDVVCLLGAGDVWRIADLLGARISAKPS